MKSRTLLAVLVGVAILVTGGIGAWTSASQGAGAPPGNPNDTLTAARFELTIDGNAIASFSELVEVSTGFDPEDLELIVRGSETQLKLPPRRTPPTVTLKRGMTLNIEMAAWHDLALSDLATAKRTIALVGYNAAGVPVVRYHLTNAWPSKLVVNGGSAGASQVLLETVTMTCEFILRVSI